MSQSLGEALAKLDEPFRSALLSLYRGEPQRGIDGQTHPIDAETRISPQQGMWIYEFCRSSKPENVLEIGMAYGFSTIFFLAAIARNHSGQHTAVDPFEISDWHGIALQKAREVGMEKSLRHIEKESCRAFADLASGGRQFDLIFIDGSHLFDAVLLDLTLSVPLCRIGGHIILDDMWMPSVQTLVSFARTNRADLAEIPTPIGNISMFRVIGEDKRDWRNFVPFVVSGSVTPLGRIKSALMRLMGGKNSQE